MRLVFGTLFLIPIYKTKYNRTAKCFMRGILLQMRRSFSILYATLRKRILHTRNITHINSPQTWVCASVLWLCQEKLKLKNKEKSAGRLSTKLIPNSTEAIYSNGSNSIAVGVQKIKLSSSLGLRSQSNPKSVVDKKCPWTETTSKAI